MNASNFPFNRIEFDVKRQRKDADRLIKARVDTVCGAHGFRWTKGNVWLYEADWCLKRCVLTVITVGKVKQPTLAGSVSIFLPDYYRTYRREDDLDPAEGLVTSLGAPVYAFDDRMTSESGHFSSWRELEEVLPRFERIIAERALAELCRYQTEDDLLNALLAPDWLTSVRLFATPDRRAALVTLMLAKREGSARAIEWASAEVERIKAEKPLVTSTARYQEVLRSIEHLERYSG